MASVKEIVSARTAERSVDSNGRTVKKYKRQFHVIVDDGPSQGPQFASLLAEVPALGDPYVYDDDIDFDSLADQIETQNVDGDPRQYKVNVSYSTRSSSGDAKPENPLDHPPEPRWSATMTSRVAEKTIDGNAVLNMAGQRFSNQPEIEVPGAVLSITRNVAAFNPSTIVEYVGSVNASAWRGGDARTWRCSNLSAEQVVDGKWVYVKETWEFTYREETWDIKLLNIGTMQLVGGELKDCVTSDGQPVTEEVPLTNLGVQKDPGESADELSFRVIPEKEFNALGF